ncbi:MAG: hypothetical protein KDB80_01435 [Planctomycetes bacterium]|nr:hypothetical protein [Planctomycetota bacterium]
MSSPIHSTPLRIAAAAALVGATGLFFAGCDGGSSGGATGDQTQIARPTLLNVEYGRLVDIYAYRRTNQANPDRRDSRFRCPVLIEKNVVIDPNVETEELFDAIGGERLDADFRFLPFDASVGHDELMILWDDQDPLEGPKFQAALTQAKSRLREIPASYRDQNTATRPIPVVPRNAAIKLNFDRPLGLTLNFFDANPGSLQLLEIVNDPNAVSAPQAFAPARYRVLPGDKALIVDTTLIGGEALGRSSSTGLSPSPDRQTANFRIAIPIDGLASRAFEIEQDPVPELNAIDSVGNRAVIRDFRSGNITDGSVAVLADTIAPTIIGEFPMGITAVDATTNTLTLNKRGNLVPLRGRIPFVDGAIIPTTGLPGGRTTVPTVNSSLNRERLQAGDVIRQVVMSPTGEAVTLRAEIIENLEVGSQSTSAQYPAPGLTESGSDGGELAVARVRVSTIEGFDGAGNRVTFVGDNANPLGLDCVARTRYYESLAYSGEYGIDAKVSDADRRGMFIVVDPDPNQISTPAEGAIRFVEPLSSIGLKFSEPMDLEGLDTLRNFVLANEEVNVQQFLPVLDSPKSSGLSLLASRIVDQNNDGTLLKVLPPLGLFHANGGTERYWFHALLDEVRDLSGNKLDIYDRRPAQTVQVPMRDDGGVTDVEVEVPFESFSVQLEIDPAALANRVGSRVYRFEGADEDGSKPGSIDLFGQFRLIDGELLAAETTRFSAVCDNTTMSVITRMDKGECALDGGTAGFPMYIPPQFPGTGPGFLYQVPSVVYTRTQNFPTVFQPPGPPVNFGGIVEPHVRRGSRMQMTYREDDFGLSMHDKQQFNIDVEQLHWAPWNDGDVLFDEFDRYSILLGHSDKRPDLAFFLNDADNSCDLDCGSLNSGLSLTFDENVLNGSKMKRVVDNAKYVVQPSLAFRTGNTKFVPYAQFEDTYTWRDSRLVSWDMETDSAIGLGGVLDATQVPPNGDRTASVSSPWTPDMPNDAALDHTEGFIPGPGGFVRDFGDFLGDRTRDHDPIALPLLVEFRVFPDNTLDTATSANLFWIGHVGRPYSDQTVNFDAGGYYNQNHTINTQGRQNGTGQFTHASCTGAALPNFRVHSSGGIDPVSGEQVLINPDDEVTARGGIITDIGIGALPHTGLARVPAGDSHQHWAQADFVRRVSVVTAGFFDTWRPNRHALDPLAEGAPPALPSDLGRPVFDGDNFGVGDLLVLTDPPFQSGGATLTVELRGAERIGDGGSNEIYDPLTDDHPSSRGNLLNPNYACEAYRYASPTANAFFEAVPRVPATGLTPYVEVENLDTIRDNRGLLPRYMNYRIVMENNIDSVPTVSPKLRNLMIVYRMAPR